MRTCHAVFAALLAFASIQSSYASLPFGRNPVILDSGDIAGEQGWSVDISGNLAIVGSPFYQGGSAFVYDLSTGDLVHRLKASDSSNNALFGFSVAIDGDLAIVASGQRNAAYVFDVTTGTQLHKLTPTGDREFVRSVDISDGIAVLGSPGAQSGSPYANDWGAAFLYNARTGSQIKRINGPTSFNKISFGGVVAIEGDTVAVTSPSYGSRHDVYVLDASTGNLRWTYGYNTGAGPFYTKDVVIDGDRVVVGAGSGSLFDMPRALVFDSLSGELQRQFDIQVTNPGDDYRSQLDVSGDRLVVGAWGTYLPETGYYTGAVYSFDINNGNFLGTISNPDPVSGSEFGYSVALENERLVVGATGASNNRGLVYSYIVVPEPATLLSVMVGVLMMGSKAIRGRRAPLWIAPQCIRD